MAWYKSLLDESIGSWKQLGRTFSRHFTASRRHPKTEALLEAIIQGKEEPLRAYIERFNKEAVQVSTTDDMKKYLLERGLRPRSDFAKAVGIETPDALDAFLLRAQAYIQYEEKEAANSARDSRHQENARSLRHEDSSTSRRGGDKRRDDRPRESREHKGLSGGFHDYTPLTVSREKILTECTNSEFKQAGVCFPKQLPTRSNTDKTKYCRFHKSHDHNTEDCIHLKDAIEILIRDGHLKQFTKGKEAPRQEVQESKKIEEDTTSSDGTRL